MELSGAHGFQSDRARSSARHSKGEELTYASALEHYEYSPKFFCLCCGEQWRITDEGLNAPSRDEKTELLPLASRYVGMKYWRELEIRRVS